MAVMEPGQQAQGAFGVGTRRSRHQQHMESLAGQAEYASQAGLVAPARQSLRAEVGQGVPQRRVGTGLQGGVVPVLAGAASGSPRRALCGFDDGGERVGERVDHLEAGMGVAGGHGTNLRAQLPMSFIR